MRAKYNNDPRVCPGCSRQMLYARSMMMHEDIGNVDVDHCNGCKKDFFRGEEVRGKGPATRAQRLARVKAIRAQAATDQKWSASYARSAREFAEFAAALERSLAIPDMTIAGDGEDGPWSMTLAEYLEMTGLPLDTGSAIAEIAELNVGEQFVGDDLGSTYTITRIR